MFLAMPWGGRVGRSTAELCLAEAKRLYTEYKNSDSEAKFREALDNGADPLVCWRHLARLAMRGRRWGDAEICWRNVASLAPDDDEPHYEMGRILEFQNKSTKAVECYAAAEKRAPAKDRARNALQALRESEANGNTVEHAKSAAPEKQDTPVKPHFDFTDDQLVNKFQSYLNAIYSYVSDYDSKEAEFVDWLRSESQQWEWNSIAANKIETVLNELRERRAKLLDLLSRQSLARNLRSDRLIDCYYVMDRFTESCISPFLAGERLRKNGYIRQSLREPKPYLFLESTWAGNDGDWEGCMTFANPDSPPRAALDEATELAKFRKSKIIFYNKEDPLHFDKFAHIAKKADHIFTSDSGSIENYKRLNPEADVNVLKFAAPTHLTNPIGRPRFDARGSVAFAGTWYGLNHADRLQQMEYLLPAIAEHNGVIFDRHSANPNGRYRYPAEFQPYCRPALPFEEIVREYKKFKVFLNVNTVTSSPTMLARRVYELLASGTPVVSGPSHAIEQEFGELVSVVTNRDDAIDAVGRLIDDKPHWERVSHLGYRHVMTHHTYKHRIREMEAALGLSTDTHAQPLISILAPTKEPGDHVQIAESVARQGYENIELVIGFGQKYSDRDVRKYLAKLESVLRRAGKRIAVKHQRFGPSVSLGSKLNALVDLASGEFVAKMDDDDRYGEDYLSDQILPLQWGDFDVVGKGAIFVHDQGSNRTFLKNPNLVHRNDTHIFGATILTRRDVLKRFQFENRRGGEDTFLLKKLRSAGLKIYSTDPYNFVCLRRDAGHTWTLPENFFDKQAEYVSKGLPLDRVEL